MVGWECCACKGMTGLMPEHGVLGNWGMLDETCWTGYAEGGCTERDMLGDAS